MSEKMTVDVIKADVQNAFDWLKVRARGGAEFQDAVAAEARVVAFLAQCEAEPTTDALIAALRDRLKPLKSGDRLDLFDAILAGYCVQCGDEMKDFCSCNIRDGERIAPEADPGSLYYER